MATCPAAASSGLRACREQRPVWGLGQLGEPRGDLSGRGEAEGYCPTAPRLSPEALGALPPASTSMTQLFSVGLLFPSQQAPFSVSGESDWLRLQRLSLAGPLRAPSLYDLAVWERVPAHCTQVGAKARQSSERGVALLTTSAPKPGGQHQVAKAPGAMGLGHLSLPIGYTS